MNLKTMHDLFIAQLTELHAGEQHSLNVLPVLAKAASAPELARAFREHADQTRRHAERLGRIFAALGHQPRPRESHGMKGLLEDCLALSRHMAAEPHVRDAALIAVAQHVQHDEIAGYGCARTWAKLLDKQDAARALQQTLDEEKEADATFTHIAGALNAAAVGARG